MLLALLAPTGIVIGALAILSMVIVRAYFFVHAPPVPDLQRYAYITPDFTLGSASAEYLRSQWTFGTAPLGVSEERVVDALVAVTMQLVDAAPVPRAASAASAASRSNAVSGPASTTAARRR